MRCFNPRARTGRDSRRTDGLRSRWCFNPRARTGRDGSMLLRGQEWDVSIHAPARGATAPVARRSFPGHCFNPRARTGRDLQLGRQYLGCELFQSPRPHGARPRASRRSGAMSWFQSTRPHGARQQSSALGSECVRFNPRARTGRDVRLHAVRGCEVVSIHAPARGATPDGGAYSYEALFQSTRPHGARPGSRSAGRRCGGFNPRARTGRDVGGRVHFEIDLVFQSTRPHGARPALNSRKPASLQFQSTRPHGARQPLGEK